MIAAEHLVGKDLVSSSDGKLLGEIKECVCDLAKGKIVGLVVDASVCLRGQAAVAAKEIEVIGEDAVLVSSEDALVEVGAVAGLEDLMRPPEAPPLIVLTKQGKRLGHLGSIVIDPDTQKVLGYEVTGGPLRELTEGTPVMPIMDGVVHGEDSILLPPEAEGRAVAESTSLARLWQRVTVGVSRLRESVEETAERAERAVREATRRPAETRAQAAKPAPPKKPKKAAAKKKSPRKKAAKKAKRKAPKKRA